MRALISTLEVRRSGVGRFLLIDQEHDYEQEQEANFFAKKVPPPTPDGREGRLFPPEQS